MIAPSNLMFEVLLTQMEAKVIKIDMPVDEKGAARFGNRLLFIKLISKDSALWSSTLRLI